MCAETRGHAEQGNEHDDRERVARVFDVGANNQSDSANEFDDGGDVGKEHRRWEAHAFDHARKHFHAWHWSK